MKIESKDGTVIAFDQIGEGRVGDQQPRAHPLLDDRPPHW